MPQDHASWDRKDLLKQRKHERSEQSFDSNFRWSNSSTVSSSRHVRRDFSRRGSEELGRHPGHGKQSGWHQFVKETDHGHASSQSRARIFEDDNYRPNASRGDRRYNRNPRDGRVSFIQKDWKYHTWGVNNGSSRVFGRLPDRKLDCFPVDERPSSASDLHTAMLKLSVPANSTQQNVEVWAPVRTLTGKTEKNFANQRQSTPLYEQPYLEDKHDNKVCSPGKQCHDVSSEQRLAEKSSLHPSNSLVDLEVTWGQLHSKDQLDNKENGSDEIDIAKQSGKESSLVEIDWKYPIWTRSGSFAYRGSGFNLSSSPKSFGAVDFHEQKTEFVPKVVAVTESTSGDDAASFTSSCLPEEINSRKKPRLGWGEGLAKYEKKKVDANVSEDGTLLTNSTREVYSLPDKSPTMVGATDFGCPATPSSVACSSSPGMGDKASTIAAKAVSDSSNLLSSPSPVSNYQLERFTLNLDDMGKISMENLSCLINALLRTDDSGTGNSCSVLSNAINKVLAWKVDILKALEVTESEIDLLENKRRALQFEAGSFCPHQNGSSSYLCVSNKDVPSKLGAHCVAERLEEAVHKALLAKVPDDACGDVVERSQDTVDLCSIKMATSSTNVDMSGFAIGSTMINNDAVDISYGGCCMASEKEVYTLLASNRKSASEASEVFKMLLPGPFSCLDVSRFSAICQEKVDPHIKQKIAARKRHMRVKDKILVLKFKAFQLSWKRDMHRLFIAKYNAKSQKNRESNMYIRHGALQKLPQSVCLKFSSPAPGIHSPSPATELLNFMEKLLPDIQHKPCRDILRMPAMILDKKENVISRFVSSNGLVEDPCAVEKERTMINPWTSKEKEIFLNKLATYGKDFRKIASHLEQKTTADCIDFYYKNHKSFCFEKIKKKHYSGKEGKCTYMLAPQKKMKREMGAASLDILGAVSMIAANASKVASTRQMPSKRIAFRSCSGSRSLQPSKNSSEGCVYNFDLTHKQTVSADGLTGGDCSLSSGPISSCFRSYVASDERCLKYSTLDPTLKMCRLSDAIHKYNSNDEDDSCSEESCEQTGPVHWTDEERSAFVQGFWLYGKNFAMISRCVGTRSQDQCRVYFSKIKKCLGSELILPRSGNVSTSASFDNCIEGNGSEVENPCALEASSVMCNGDLCAKMDACSPKSPLNINHDGVEHSSSLKTHLDRSEQENGSACLHFKDDTELADTSVSRKRDCPDLVSAFGRDFLDVKTVENQSQAVQKSKSDQLLSAATNEGLSASTIVSPWPSSSNASMLANFVFESFAERSRKYYIPTPTENRTRDPSIHAETASSSGVSFPECLHHVPIKVCMEDPISLHLLQENPSSHSETVSPSSFAVQDVKRGNLETRSSSVHLSFGEKNRFHGHVKYDQNSLQDVHIGNKDVLQIPRSSFMPDPSKQKRSKSDVIANTIQHTGEGFSLNRCSSLTSSFSTAKKLRLSHKDGRSDHGQRHSSSLSDTERPYKNRVVKLFGTILASHEHEKMQHPQGSVRPSAIATDLHELQNVPITSYGFWDGNRIRTGFTSLQHPEAFTKHVESSVSEVQAGSSREIQVDGLSVYTRWKLNGSSEIPRFVTESQMDHGRDNLGFMSFGNDEHKKRGHR